MYIESPQKYAYAGPLTGQDCKRVAGMLYIAQMSERDQARKARANARARGCVRGWSTDEGCAARGRWGKRGRQVRGGGGGGGGAHVSGTYKLKDGVTAWASERASDRRHGTQHIAHTDHINQRLLRAFLIIRQPLTIPRF